MTKIFLSLSLLSTIILISCKKTNINQNFQEIPITSQSYQNQIHYANEKLLALASEIAKLNTDVNFTNFVINEAKKKFDGEYEVLIDDLKKSKEFGYRLNSKEINAALNSFKNLENQNFYPQIYIPKYQYDEENSSFGKSNSENIVSINQIIYVIYDGNKEVDNLASAQGYYLDDTKHLVPFGLVNEAYANTHPVWIISLNECVNNQGKLMQVLEPTESTGGGGTTTNNGTSGTQGTGDGIMNYKIGAMVVKQHKESWLAGGSEIAIKAFINTRNGRLGGGSSAPIVDYYTSGSSTADLQGIFIRKFKRWEINSQIAVNVIFPLHNNWDVNNYYTNPIMYQYVIFERDLWPTGVRTAAQNPYFGELDFSGIQSFCSYRSADDEYIKSSFYANKSGMTQNIPPNSSSIISYQNNFMTYQFKDNAGITLTIAGY